MTSQGRATMVRSGGLPRGSRVRRLLDALRGTIMVGLGVRLAVAER